MIANPCYQFLVLTKKCNSIVVILLFTRHNDETKQTLTVKNWVFQHTLLECYIALTITLPS